MFELVNKARKNRGGFSLVELIVVVLIIAIIAVALAPQVMKYVGKARTGTDANNAATIKSSVQTAIADFQSCGGTISSAQEYEVAATGVTHKSGTEPSATKEGASSASLLSVFINDVLGSDVPTPRDASKKFYVHISESGGVTVDTTAPSGSTPVTPAG